MTYVFQARACCGKRTGSVIVVSNPYIMEDMLKTGKAGTYADSPIAKCPEGWKVSACGSHT